VRAVSLTRALALLLFFSPAASAQEEESGPPESAPASGPTSRPTSTGSMAPGVTLEDVSYTVRTVYFKSLGISHKDPDTAFLGSFDGYVWRTTDGGKTWDESRLIPEIKPFFGDGWETLYFGVHRSDGRLESNLDGSPPVRPRSGGSGGVSSAIQVGGGAGAERRGAAQNVNFGIGVPGGAPRLQLLVRKLGKPTSGLNIKQTLLLRGSRPTSVRRIVFHPRDTRVVFACTSFGLFRTTDGGDNWVRTFVGTSPPGRETFHIAVDPANERRVLLATGEGLYVSNDGGDNFMKSPDKGVGEGVINWVYYNPFDPRYVFAGTNDGLLRSSDRGSSWEYIYYTTFPAARVVRGVVIDPFDRKTGYIATHDGIFSTPDLLTGDLESWRRMGGLSFTGVEVARLEICPRHPGHMWALTSMMLANLTDPGLWPTGGAFVYETIDGGKTWKPIFSGTTAGTMQWFEQDPRDPDLLWFVWSRALLRMTRRPPSATRRTAAKMPDDPPIGDVIVAALRYTGVDPAYQLRYRRRALLKALLPQVDVAYHHYVWHDHGRLGDLLYPTLPYRRFWGGDDIHREMRVMLTWNLGELLFNLEGVLFGRIERINWEMRDRVNYSMHRFYGELRRLRVLLANSPPGDLRMRLMYKLRIEELSAYVDFMTGGYLTRWRRGDRPQGTDTPWFERWPGPGG